jgi:hypothetical protein
MDHAQLMFQFNNNRHKISAYVKFGIYEGQFVNWSQMDIKRKTYDIKVKVKLSMCLTN